MAIVEGSVKKLDEDFADEETVIPKLRVEGFIPKIVNLRIGISTVSVLSTRNSIRYRSVSLCQKAFMIGVRLGLQN